MDDLFLALVHRVCENRIARRQWTNIEALATIIYYEQPAYEQWHSQPQTILRLLEKYFHPDWRTVALG
jgi:hypothetical protein